MKFKLLGRTGVYVSELCFGTMSFGGDADKTESSKLYAAARNAGINFFDCANAYSAGEAERILGKLVKGHRDELVITSKCAMPISKEVNSGGTNRRHLKKAVEDSLRRLDMDYIDVFLMHRWNNDTPLEETLRGLEDLVRDGKILYPGASNYAAWQIAKGLGISAANHWSRFEVIQPMYNLVRRQVESEILPLAASEQVGVMTYGPVGGGLLSGKYGAGVKPENARLVTNKEYRARYDESWVYETAAAFTAFAGDQGVHPVSLAIAWVKANPMVTCPIIGARNVEQLKPSLEAINIAMPDELRHKISALSRSPAVATDRLEERQGI